MYERLWEIRSMTCLIGFRRACIGVITCRIGTRTCCIRDCQFTRTRNSLSPSFSWWFPPSPLISPFLVLNSTITSEHKVKLSLSISPCHNHELTPSTAYTKYSIIPRSTVSPPISLDHSLPVHLQTRSVTALECITEFTRSRPPSACPNSLDHGLQVHVHTRLFMASKCMSKLAGSRPPSACPNSLDHGLQVHVRTRSIMSSKYIPEFTPSRPSSASPNSLDHSLPVHLHTRSITASKCISQFTPSWPPSASPTLLDHGLHVYR